MKNKARAPDDRAKEVLRGNHDEKIWERVSDFLVMIILYYFFCFIIRRPNLVFLFFVCFVSVGFDFNLFICGENFVLFNPA